MKLEKILFILSFPIICEILFSCCCSCPEKPKDGYYSNCNLWLTNIDNSGIHPEKTKSNDLPKNAFGLSIAISGKKMYA